MKIALTFLLFFIVTPAYAADWPRMTVHDREECTQAFALAQSVFRSKSFYLYAPPTIPKEVKSTLIFGPSELDLSGGDGIDFNEDTFTRIDTINPPLYWQTDTNTPERIVVQLNRFGWRGDQYTLYTIPKDITSETFITEYDRGRRQAPWSPVITENWRPPLIFKTTNSTLWAIDIGHPAAFFANWRVYTSDLKNNGSWSLQCSIDFGPQNAKEIKSNFLYSTALLPKPVQTLATLLDGTLGDGRNEGTLNTTARIQVKVNHTWVNVALRPWALSNARVYNSREDVDRNLKAWALPVKSFYELHQKIYTQYPTAQRALEKYYIKEFKMPEPEAKKLAAEALDIAFRSYFIFPQTSTR